MGTTEIPTGQDPRLVEAYRLDRVCTGVTTTTGGRCFVSFPSADGPGVQVAEVAPDSSTRPYPDESWNAVRADHDPAGHFVRVNALRVGPASGPLSRIETRWLDDVSVPASSLGERVEEWVDTATTGGTAIDADGVI